MNRTTKLCKSKEKTFVIKKIHTATIQMRDVPTNINMSQWKKNSYFVKHLFC